MGPRGGDQEAAPAFVLEGLEMKTGVGVDQGEGGTEIADLDAHPQDPFAALRREVRDQAGAVRFQQGQRLLPYRTSAPRPPRNWTFLFLKRTSRPSPS